jgi:hypothetical protein
MRKRFTLWASLFFVLFPTGQLAGAVALFRVSGKSRSATRSPDGECAFARGGAD